MSVGSRLLRRKIGECHDCWPEQPYYPGRYRRRGERGQQRKISDRSYLRAALERLFASIAKQLLNPQRSLTQRSVRSIRSDVSEYSGRFGETDSESCRALLGPP